MKYRKLDLIFFLAHAHTFARPNKHIKLNVILCVGFWLCRMLVIEKHWNWFVLVWSVCFLKRFTNATAQTQTQYNDRNSWHTICLCHWFYYNILCVSPIVEYVYKGWRHWLTRQQKTVFIAFLLVLCLTEAIIHIILDSIF